MEDGDDDGDDGAAAPVELIILFIAILHVSLYTWYAFNFTYIFSDMFYICRLYAFLFKTIFCLTLSLSGL